MEGEAEGVGLLIVMFVLEFEEDELEELPPVALTFWLTFWF